ncbi:dipeptidase, partial [Hellea sp.]|nr:dipeptidase [Hellea sp.]
RNWKNMAAPGGLTGGSFTIGAGGIRHFKVGGSPDLLRFEDWWSYETTLDDVAIMKGEFANPDNKIVQATKVADIRQAKVDGNVALMLNTQNSIWIGYSPERIKTMYNHGLRVVQLTYNQQNFIGSGCQEDANNHLSEFGVKMIGALNDQGMLVDTGHTGAGTIRHAIEVSEKPISCSHAGMEWQAKGQDRVQTDDTLKILADSGGVFGLSSIPGMLTGKERCTVNDYLDGIEHAIKLMGIEHVGLGTDFVFNVAIEQIGTSPDWQGATVPVGGTTKEVFDNHEGFEDHSKFINVTRGLVGRGYSDDDITKIMGGNWLRLIGDTIG